MNTHAVKLSLFVLWASFVLSACGSSRPAPKPQVAEAAPEAAEPTMAAPAPAATPRNPERAAELLAEGRRLQQELGEDGAEAAIRLYRKALQADAQAVAAHWEMGWSLQVLGRWNEAVQAWEQLQAMQPDHAELPKHLPVLRMRRDAAEALAALPEPGMLPEPEEEPRQGPTIRLNAVGDIQMGRAWPEAQAAIPDDDGRPLFVHVADLLRDADVTFGNLETVLADAGESTKCKKGSNVCYAFRAPTRFTAALLDAGFDLLSIANNHTGDFGEEGRQATVDALTEAGLHHSGPVGNIASLETNGLKIGMVAFSTGGGLYQLQDIETARKVVAEVDKSHDIVIVSYHGGAEGSKATHVPKEIEMFYGENRGDVFAFSRAMVDAGADLVLGHGPHVLRAMEVYRGRLIAYSLGNFSAWTGFNLAGPLGIAAILKVTLAANGVALDAKLTPLVIDQPGVPRPDPKRQAIDIVRRLSTEDMGSPLFDKKGTWVRPASGSQTRAW